jgi:hypothetical protein
MKNVTPKENLPVPDEKERLKRKRISESKIRNDEAHLQSGLRVLQPDDLDDNGIPELAGRRTQYKPLRLHQEKAAMAIAAGATLRAAAKFADVSPRQVRKYMTMTDFRDRVTELRQIVMSRIQGKIISEINRRVSSDQLKSMEPLDIVRFYNLTVGGKDKGLADSINVNIKYDQIFNSITAEISNPNASSESEDFPQYGAEDLLLPGGDSSGD